MTMPKPTHTIQADGIRLSVFHTKPASSANEVAIMIERDQGRSGEAWYPTATIRGDDLHALGKAVHEVLLLLSTAHGSVKPLSPPTPRTVTSPTPPTATESAIEATGSTSGGPTQASAAARDPSGSHAATSSSGSSAGMVPHASMAATPAPITTNPSASAPTTPSVSGKISVPQPTGSISRPIPPGRHAAPGVPAKALTSARGSKVVRRAVAAVAGKHRGR